MQIEKRKNDKVELRDDFNELLKDAGRIRGSFYLSVKTMREFIDKDGQVSRDGQSFEFQQDSISFTDKARNSALALSVALIILYILMKVGDII